MLQDYPNTQLFINGEWQNSKSNETLEIINPATEEVIGKLSHARKEDLDEALMLLKMLLMNGKTFQLMRDQK